MLHFFSGTDRQKAREALVVALENNKGAMVPIAPIAPLWITDAHALADLYTALSGGGMFAQVRSVVLDGVLSNDEMRNALLASLPVLKASAESFFMLEGAIDAATRKQIEKYASVSEKFDAKKPIEEKTIFALANALQRGDKKALWIGLMREYGKGSAPEAVHGLLFWGAKQQLMRNATDARARALVALLAELPHEARRRGEDLSYAIERFALSRV
jgi:hypothetical protein